MCACPAPAGHSARLRAGRAARGPLIFLVVSPSSVGCIPSTLWGPACHASYAGLLWKAVIPCAQDQLEALLILSQHRHSPAAQTDAAW